MWKNGNCLGGSGDRIEDLQGAVQSKENIVDGSSIIRRRERHRQDHEHQ